MSTHSAAPVTLEAGGPAAPVEVVCCASDPVALDRVVDLVATCPMVIEPSAARALAHCLRNPSACLVVDLAGLDPRGLSALVQFRLLRPEQPIVLLGGERDIDNLERTLLDGLPLIALRRAPCPPS
jgi:hypothetical protein